MTAQAIDTAIIAIAAVAASATGVDAAPSSDLFNVNENTFALTYLMASASEISEIGTMQDLALIACDVLTPFEQVASLGLLPILRVAKNIKLAFIQEVTSGGDFFGNTISAVSFCRVEFLPNYIYGGIQFIGYRVILEDVKLKYDL